MNQESTNQPLPPATTAPIPTTHVVLRALIPAVVVIALSVLGILYGQRVIDHIKANIFQPTKQVASVETRLKLSSRGKDIFYATQPTIEQKAEFNNNCQSQERTAAILGCYYRDRIYLYDIENEQLDGTLEVTAAHEMLHAAYQRLNWFERRDVDTMIRAQYAKVKNNQNLKEVMKYYAKAEPGAEINELHSILGTTIAGLDPALEQYYRQYFKDRAAVVELNAAYNKVFGELKSKADELESKIKAAEPQLTADLAAYDTDLKQLESDIESFNQQVASGSYTSRGAFTATRSALLARVDDLNARRDGINARVSAYNADVEALNALSVQAGDLYKSINGAETAAGI